MSRGTNADDEDEALQKFSLHQEVSLIWSLSAILQEIAT